MMKPREVGGALKSCKVAYVWVWLNDESGVFIQVSKTEAREVVDACKEDDLEEMLAYTKGDEVFIGDDDEEGGAEASEGDTGEEEEDGEEEEGEEESEEEEEEETPVKQATAATKKKAR